MRTLLVAAALAVACVGLAAARVGPAWTNDDSVERPAGEKDMGGWTAAVFTPEQQARLGVDEFGKPAPATAAPVAQSQCKMPTDAYPPPASTVIPWYTIDLDSDPKTRWAAVVTPFAQKIHDMVYSVLDLIPEKLRDEILSKLTGNEDRYLNAFPAPYGDEIRGIGSAINMDLASLILFNIAYELEGGCTSIVAEDPSGVPHHARNLDFGLFLGWDKVNHTWQLAEKLRPLLFNARFIKDGQVLYNATYFAGYVGLLTGMRTGGFSITVDTRFDDTFWGGLQKWLDGDFSGHFLSFTTRSVMENNSTYHDALLSLNNTKMIGPSYMILGGVNSGEGAVITREGPLSLNLWTIQNNLHNTNFYVVETNYDHWVKPPFYDNRMTPAEDCLNQVGQENISFSSLFNVLSGQPNLNMLTTYTTLMCPKTGAFEAYIQDCPAPCSPW